MQRRQVENCALPVWYQHFRPVTFDTVFIQLTPDFLAYLQSDGIVIPPSLLPTFPNNPVASSFSDDEDENDEEEWEEPPQAPQPDFPDLERHLKAGIESLGGEVFPKLNWSAPRDASWIMSDGTLCARTPLDIILLLKGSEFIQHDLTQAFVECTTTSPGGSEVPRGGFVLCLRRWENILPAGEFRCFVREHRLIGISQRHHRQHFPSVVADRTAITNDLQHFFFRYIQHQFPDANYVVDVYRPSPHHVLLVDFNPFSRVTDPLLFTWDELLLPALLAPTSGPVPLRVVETPTSVKSHPYAVNRVPADIVGITDQQGINEFVSMFNSNNLAEEDSDNEEELR